MTRIRAFLCLAGGMALLAAAALSLPAAAAMDPAPAGVALVRSGSGAISELGGTIVLPLEALDVSSLGAATIQVNYDRSVISVTGCVLNSAFDLRLWATITDTEGLPVAVRVGLIDSDGLTGTSGTPLNLANISWTLVGTPPPGQTIALGVEVRTFSDTPDGKPIPVVSENGQILVAEAYRRLLPLVVRQE